MDNITDCICLCCLARMPQNMFVFTEGLKIFLINLQTNRVSVVYGHQLQPSDLHLPNRKSKSALGNKRKAAVIQNVQDLKPKYILKSM